MIKKHATILSTNFWGEAVPGPQSRKGAGRSYAVFPVLLGITLLKGKL